MIDTAIPRMALVALSCMALAACGSTERCPQVGPHASDVGEHHPATAGSPTVSKKASEGSSIDVGGAGAPDAVFRLTIGKDGRLWIEGQRLDDPRELSARVRVSARARPDLQVLILTDRELAFAHVVNAVELVKQGGVSRITFGFDNAVPAGPQVAQPLRSVPTLEPGWAWRCDVQEHIDNLDKLTAFVAIHVGPDGEAQTVEVIEDPGHGLGEAARSCAYKQKFRPAVDASGKPTVGVLKLVVSFRHHQH